MVTTIEVNILILCVLLIWLRLPLNCLTNSLTASDRSYLLLTLNRSLPVYIFSLRYSSSSSLEHYLHVLYHLLFQNVVLVMTKDLKFDLQRLKSLKKFLMGYDILTYLVQRDLRVFSNLGSFSLHTLYSLLKLLHFIFLLLCS